MQEPLLPPRPKASSGDVVGTVLGFLVLMPVSFFCAALVPFISVGPCLDQATCIDELTYAGAVVGWLVIAAAWLGGAIACGLASNRGRSMSPWAWGANGVAVLGPLVALALGGIAAL